MNQFQSGIWAGALGGSLALDTPIARYYAADCVVSGGKVTMWPPRFGNPLNVLSTPDPARRPGWSANGGHGGKPCLTFDGTQGISTDNFYLPVGVTDIVQLAVFRISVSTYHVISLFGSNGTGTSATGGITLRYFGDRPQIRTFGNAGTNSQYLPPASISLYVNKWMRAGGMGYLSDPNPETATYVNGVKGTVITGENADNTSYFSNVTRLCVGQYIYNTGFLIGDLCELHIYPRLTTPEFLELDAQVAATYPPFP